MHRLIIALFLVLLVNSSFRLNNDGVWGFYAHKLINQHAIYLLPVDLIPLFKTHLKEIRHFAIAPDQRRHSSPHEAARHYMDLDQWGEYPFNNVPRDYDDAVWKMADVWILKSATDSVNVKSRFPSSIVKDSLMRFFHRTVRFHDRGVIKYSAEEVGSAIDISNLGLGEFEHLIFKNHLDDYGILPYHLLEYQNRLKWAFVDRDLKSIIRLAGELGHYIGDAHVPLHTTLNYNGQLTGQDGIHAFWESRIPELFATSDYDFWVTESSYIKDKQDFFWNIVLESHQLVDDVLSIEKNLRSSFPKEKQYCFDERLGVTQRLECREFARAYQNEMNGMVEKRMRQAITAIASSWYTAWVDAGSPQLNEEQIEFEPLIKIDTLQMRNKSESRKIGYEEE